MSKIQSRPRCFIIAGPNGAGKTTFARRYLPYYAECDVFVNADLIAAGLSPFAPALAAIKAGRLVLEQIEWFAELHRDFAFETTLAGRTYIELLKRLKADGYRVSLYFLWLQTAELAISRVAKRVSDGGHHVPEEDLRRRYDRGLRNLFELYRPLLDEWTLLDNSESRIVPVAKEVAGSVLIFNPTLFACITGGMEVR
jgi:predicted ABC-type ATPase